MNRGNLTFKGTIDLNQFWPQNAKSGNPYDSDADTVKVKIDPKSVTFTSSSGNTKKTLVLNKAGFWHNIKKKGGIVQKHFSPVIDKKGMINMRLQGIDAPELHYMTGTPLYRQHMGETSTVKLYDYLKSNTQGSTIDCDVFTQVNKPNDVFDKYGRCVGDIVIRDKGRMPQNVNHWLVQNGFAFPAFYNSMTSDEITKIQSLGNDAKKNKRNIWDFYTKKMTPLDRSLTHDKKDASYSQREDEKSPVIFPKLFRRLWTFEIGKGNGFTTQGYHDFLVKNADSCCLTNDFLQRGYPSKNSPKLSDYVSGNGDIQFDPADLVFKEGGTSLKDDQGNVINSF